MNLCSNGHDEVCYDALECPACQLNEEIAERDKQIVELEKKVEKLEDEITKLEEK
jgi:predicted  nucleic acid-binding Zn-ribbon protein